LPWREPIEFASVADAALALLLALLCSTVVSYVLTPLVRGFAAARGWVDSPDGRRKLHAAPVPRVGGLAVFAALVAGSAAAVLLLPGVRRVAGAADESPAHLLAAALGICLLGLIDDRRSLSPRVKLAAEAVAGLYVYAHGYAVLLVSNPFGPTFALGWLSLPVTVLWVVGLTNAFNLIDGLDGLAAGVGLFASSVVLVFALLNGHPDIAILSIALAGALLGFLRYNFSPASVFLGDCGSLTLGFVLAALSLRGSMKGPVVVAVATPLLALGFPLLDTALALLRRLWGGRSILAADADHIHHRIVRRGLTPRRAVILLYGVTAFFGAVALVALTDRPGAVVLAVIACSSVTWWGIRVLGDRPAARERERPEPVAAPLAEPSDAGLS
jgi:UDP-GlcNAc:undecaprenyl-phosphate/decaprenyl-phosphate GlcNAc-1-phosphate transferase